ncbi:MAG: hypothetical protein ACK476_05005 [Fluviicola sp.]
MKPITFIFSFIFINHFFGQVTIEKDARIDQLVKNQSQIIPPATSPQISGYRIQLSFDQSKSVIDEQRARFVSLFPKIDTYVEYNAPNYFLKVGDFRSQLEAENIKAQAQNQFPLSFVIKEKINLPRIDQ